MRPAFNNILVATDFSIASNKVVNTAIELCKQHNAVMHLIHVKESRYILDNPEPDSVTSSIIQDIDQEAKYRLCEIYDSVLRDYNIAMQIHMPEGIPFDEICKAASEMPIDLIVMGRSGTSGDKSNLLGSTTYNVVKYAVKPVLTIPFNFSGTDFKNILIPLRFAQAVKDKYDLLRPFFNEKIVQVHAGLFSLFKDGEKGTCDDNNFTEFQFEINEKGVSYTYEFYSCKNIAAKVLEVSALLQSDLIVISSTMNYRWTQFSLSPYTSQMINCATVPVLSLRNCINIANESKKERKVIDTMNAGAVVHCS